jgi:hypothetical protein
MQLELYFCLQGKKGSTKTDSASIDTSASLKLPVRIFATQHLSFSAALLGGLWGLKYQDPANKWG